MVPMRRARSFLPVDPFLLWLVSVVGVASLLPARGSVAPWFEGLADIAIALLFFLHGAKLSRAAIWSGIGNWRLHALVLASTYLVFPALGLGTVAIVREWISPLLLSGLLFLTLLPSTVQSSIAFTAMAKGNVAAAVCSASLSNLLGIFITPLLVGVLITAGTGGGGFDWSAVQTIVVQLLVPFLAGHFLRPVIGGFVDHHKKLLLPVDRGSILLVVYSAFSAAVVEGIWSRIDIGDLALLLLICAAILVTVMLVNVLIARLTDLPREDFIVLLFCGSKKSLVSGVPMAGALFAPTQVGMIVLPLMIFHQLQLFLCAWLAARFANSYAESAPPSASAASWADRPPTIDQVTAEAERRGLSIPEACLPGVAANLELLAGHARTLSGGMETECG